MFEKLNLNPFFNYKNYEVKYKTILQEIFSRRKHLYKYTNDEILLEVMNFCNNVDILEYVDVDADMFSFYMPGEGNDPGRIVLNKQKIERLQEQYPYESIAMAIFNFICSSVTHAILDDKRTGEFGLYPSNNFDKVEVLDEITNKAFATLITGNYSDDVAPEKNYLANIIKTIDIISASLGLDRIEFLKLTNLKRKKFEQEVIKLIGNEDVTLDIINCFSLNLSLLYSAMAGKIKNNNIEESTIRKNILNAIASLYSVALIAMNTRLKNTPILDDINLYISNVKLQFAILNKSSFELMDYLNLTIDEKEIIYSSLKEHLNSINIKIALLTFISANRHVIKQEDVELLLLAMRESNLKQKAEEIAQKYGIDFSYEEFNYKKYIDYKIDTYQVKFDNTDIIEYIDNAFNLESVRNKALQSIDNYNDNDGKVKDENNGNVDVNDDQQESSIKVYEADDKFDDEYSQIDKIIDNMITKENESMSDTKTVPIVSDKNNFETESSINNKTDEDILEDNQQDESTALSRNKDLEPYEDDLDKGILECLKPKEPTSLSIEDITSRLEYEQIEEEDGESTLKHPILEAGKSFIRNIKNISSKDEQYYDEDQTLSDEEEVEVEDSDDISNYETNIKEEDYVDEDVGDSTYGEYEEYEQINLFDSLSNSLKKLSYKIKYIFKKRNNNMLPPSADLESTDDVEGHEESVNHEEVENTDHITKRVRKGRR